MNQQDFRKPLSFADNVNDDEHNYAYRILAEIGRGGSSIVYEASRIDKESKLESAKHYALKEYYPINEALMIRRDEGTLHLLRADGTQCNSAKYFQREQFILDHLPWCTNFNT